MLEPGLVLFFGFLGGITGHIVLHLVKKYTDHRYKWACRVQGCTFRVSSNQEFGVNMIRDNHLEHHRENGEL